MSTNTPPAKTWEGVLLDAIIALYTSNEAAATALLAQGNVTVENFAEAGLEALLAKEPFLKLVIGSEVAALPSQLAPFLAKEEGYAVSALLAYLQALAVKYGG
jgi:hypothetical protein